MILNFPFNKSERWTFRRMTLMKTRLSRSPFIRKCIVSFTCLVLIALIAFFIRPLRNLILLPVWHAAWRPLQTAEFFRYHVFIDFSYTVPDGIRHSAVCHKTRKLPITLNDVPVNKMVQYNLSTEKQLEAVKKGHGRFLPALSKEFKTRTFLVYMVMAHVLKEAGVPFFMVDGPLLGVQRHSGFVPWDDDLDVAIHYRYWALVTRVLGCIEGTKLHKGYNWHWAFYDVTSGAFTDIFFYDYNEEYLWALSDYTRNQMIYPTDMVFPLKEDEFEGIMVPVPRDSLQIVRRIYDFDWCFVQKNHVKRNMSFLSEYPDGYSKNYVPCSELQYLYKINHLHGT